MVYKENRETSPDFCWFVSNNFVEEKPEVENRRKSILKPNVKNSVDVYALEAILTF